MIIYSQNGKKLLDCISIFVAEKKDENEVVQYYEVKGTLANSRVEVISSFPTEKEAKDHLSLLAIDFNANCRPLSVKAYGNQ